MQRRTLLTTLGTGGVSFAGCLGDMSVENRESPTETPDNAGTEYTECKAPYIDYTDLPEELAAEVDGAFEDGVYVTNEEPLFPQAVSDGTPLWKDDVPYEQEVERDGESYRLSFAEQTAFSSPRRIYLSTDTDDELSAALVVTDEIGDKIVEEDDLTLVPGEKEQIQGPREFGEYEVVLEVEDDRRETEDWELDPHRTETIEGLVVSIDGKDISIKPLVSVVDFDPCPSQWD